MLDLSIGAGIPDDVIWPIMEIILCLCRIMTVACGLVV